MTLTGTPRTSQAEGATIAYVGTVEVSLGGYFIALTVLTGVCPHSTVVREEIFGPVLSAYWFTDEDEALKLANDTPYGLAGAVWTKDVHRAHRVTARLRAGTGTHHEGCALAADRRIWHSGFYKSPDRRML